MSEEKESYSLTPKGLIAMSLPDYNKEEHEALVKELCKNIYDYMKEFNLALIAVNDNLHFVDVEEDETDVYVF